MAVAPLDPVERSVLISAFKALADETRFEVFRLIAGQRDPICVCDISAQFPVSQPTISHHLKVLREAGLIKVSRRGNWAFYAMDCQGLALLDRVQSHFGAVRTVTA
jgi:ArsR family transcriptional regulator